MSLFITLQNFCKNKKENNEQNVKKNFTIHKIHPNQIVADL
jgi:hypothetical protein